MENWRGLTTQVAYTYSHEIDEVSEDLNSLSNPFNPAYDRGSGSFDRRHILTLNYIYNIPGFNQSSNMAARLTLGGWQFSGVTVAQSGTPQYITYTGATDTLGLGGGTYESSGSGGACLLPEETAGMVQHQLFANPTPPWLGGGANQGFGTAGKDVVVAPGLFNFNWSLFKTIPFKEGGPSLELRFEFFNVFNHTEFGTQNSGQNTNGIDANSGTRISDRLLLPTMLVPCSLGGSSISEFEQKGARASTSWRPHLFLDIVRRQRRPGDAAALP